LNDIEYEVTNDDTIISIGVRVKDDSDNFWILSILTQFEAYYHRFQNYIHLGVELKHDLKGLFESGKSISSLITDGLYIFGHLKTNQSDVIKTGIFAYLDKIYARDAKPLVSMFLQKNFNFQCHSSRSKPQRLHRS